MPTRIYFSAIMLFLAACAGQPADSESMRVVATTSIVGDIVLEVGGDRIDLTVLMDDGADPHTYQLTAREAAMISTADVVFVNGLGLEESLLDSLEKLAPQTSIVSVSEGIEPRQLGENKIDPHVWLDPSNVMRWVENVERALSEIDAAGTPQYRHNAIGYGTELEALDRWMEEQIAKIPIGQRKLVADHDALGYFADRYGFEVIGAVIPSFSTAAEPSPQQLANLETAITELDVRAIFVGMTVNPTLAEQVAQDLGILLVPLNTGSLSGPANSYLEFMRQNVRAIVDALQ